MIGRREAWVRGVCHADRRGENKGKEKEKEEKRKEARWKESRKEGRKRMTVRIEADECGLEADTDWKK